MKKLSYIMSYISILLITVLVNNIIFNYLGSTVYYIITILLIIILLILTITYREILFILTIIIVILANNIIVYIVNDNIIYFSKENSNQQVDYCLKNLLENGMGYRYHYNNSNPVFPTLGIEYKKIYKEGNKYIILYEKRTYLNIYMGSEKLVCPDELGGEVLPLE